MNKESHTAPKPSSLSPTINEAKPLILVVDDHEDTRFLLGFVLEQSGFRIAQAADGVEAVTIARNTRPDLILMDTSLPRVDGLAAAQRIRGLAQLSKVPIIFISGHAHPEARAAALAIGANDYFVKPLDLRDLVMAVKNQLREGVNAHPLEPSFTLLGVAGH
jgi:DNA-binding response OmpR family regulator